MDGGLLLELYTRDGVSGSSTMISTDFYEGIRRFAALACRQGCRALCQAAYQSSCIVSFVTLAAEAGRSALRQCTDLHVSACRAEVTDIDAIMDLLTPLAVAGITRMRSRQDILSDLHSFTVVQREDKASLLQLCKISQDAEEYWHTSTLSCSACCHSS